MRERRPSPPVTVVVPGRSGQAAEVLVQAAPEQAPEQASEQASEQALEPRVASSRRGRRTLLTLLALLLLAGVVAQQRDRPPPAPQQVTREMFPGVQASARLLAQDPLQVRLLVEVRIAAEPVTTGLPGSGAPSAQVRLLGVSAPGLVLRLADRPPPLLLGYVGRFGGGREQVGRLTVHVVAVGCAAPERPGRLAVSLRRSTASSDVDATLPVRHRPEVAQALEELVRRSCGGAGR